MNPQYQTTLPPPPTKRPTSIFSPKIFLIGGGIVFALILAGTLLVLGNSKNPISQMQRLSARFENLQTIAEQGTKNVQGADLKKTQGDASILIIGHAATINAAMKDAGLGKVPKGITALESDEATIATLLDAQLNGRFDAVYQKALAQKLESTMALMREVNDKTNNRDLKDALSTAYTNFGGILDQLAKL